MIKVLTRILFTLLAVFILLAAAIGLFIRQLEVSRSDMDFLVDMARRDGIVAVISVIKAEIYGVDTSSDSDPSFGRENIEGRGYAPWVIRGNLDDRPRMIKFALAPDLWAAYDTTNQSLYQVWQGEVLFEGAAYNYQHGPQPASSGEYFLRDEQPARWFIVTGGKELPATVTYLGHDYGAGRATASMRFALSAGDYRLELAEEPALVRRGGARTFTRTFSSDNGDLSAVWYNGAGERFSTDTPTEIALGDSTPIEGAEGPTRGREAEDSEVEQGERIIAGSDCLGCHAETHRVAGPAWSQVSGKFRGKIQDEVVDALARSVIEGSAGTWGPVPMPPHPELSPQEARAAVIYILSVGEPAESHDPPLNARGEPYPATRSYDILPRLSELHPSFALENIAPPGFEPKVGGMDFLGDGRLVVASWDRDGAVFVVDPAAPADSRVQRIAEGLQEPLGLAVVDDRIFVLQKQELTELVDRDGDGVTDRYRTVSYDWPSSANFHSFAFGLLHHDERFYFLLSICVLPGGASCPDQLPTQGKLLRADMNGEVEVYASGFRTPNGIALARDGGIYVNDNQGDWLPSSKLVRVLPGDFYGSRAVVSDADVMTIEEVPPAVWLPQDEVGNSPTEPLELTEGPYAGQIVHGDVYNGGIKRVFLEEVDGREQGAVFHFSAGFRSSVNRLKRGPDGAIYIGELGSKPNWGEYGKDWYGLERMTWKGNQAFEILAVRAQPNGFALELTQPLADEIELTPSDLLAKQWFYRPDEQYGGPKYDESELNVASLQLSADRRTISARIDGLEQGYVVYLRLHERLRDNRGADMWTAEAWYTLNAIPDGGPAAQAAADAGWRDIFDGTSLDGWRNYGGSASAVRKWTVEDGALTLVQEGAFPAWDMIKSAAFGGGSGDLIYYREKFRNFELSLEWKISENGNSGIFYLVADEEENNPWLTGIEMQVLHNEGHADGRIETHRAGDLYDLIAADPETVRPPGEWNEVLIRIQDNRIEHWLNGVKVVAVTRASEEWDALVAASKFADMPRFGKADSGYIVLQDHGDPVWYRNIRVRNLPSSAGQ